MLQLMLLDCTIKKLIFHPFWTSFYQEVISDVDKKKIMDSKTTLSIDERWRELLDLVQATIELDEEVFLHEIMKI